MVKRAIGKLSEMGFKLDWTLSVPMLVAVASGLLAAYYAATSDIRDHDTRLKYIERQLVKREEDEKSIRAIEKTISRIEGDVSWMRTIIEKRSNLGMPNPFDPAPLSTRASNQGG